MRIKDLATRATKLLTGNAYMVFDNGTKVEKVDYAELAKQIITEYNTQTLAGSAQSVKSALDALNSNFIITNSVDDLCTKVVALPFNVNATIYTDTNATKFLTQNAFSYSAKGFVARVSSTLADAYIVAYPDTCFSVRFDFQSKTITSCTKLPTRAEMDALDARVTALENS